MRFAAQRALASRSPIARGNHAPPHLCSVAESTVALHRIHTGVSSHPVEPFPSRHRSPTSPRAIAACVQLPALKAPCAHGHAVPYLCCVCSSCSVSVRLSSHWHSQRPPARALSLFPRAQRQRPPASPHAYPQLAPPKPTRDAARDPRAAPPPMPARRLTWGLVTCPRAWGRSGAYPGRRRRRARQACPRRAAQRRASQRRRPGRRRPPAGSRRVRLRGTSTSWETPWRPRLASAPGTAAAVSSGGARGLSCRGRPPRHTWGSRCRAWAAARSTWRRNR
mmetsp:Transcript_34017/g.89495  ORF Transcript_34017/g.89495 Transcript_34017/m.89495 type:complete len:279 (+) Transcript_34017:175-1011(+)